MLKIDILLFLASLCVTLIVGLFIGERAANVDYEVRLSVALSEQQSQMEEEYGKQINELNDLLQLLEWDNDILNERTQVLTNENLRMSELVSQALRTLDNVHSSAIDEAEYDLLLRAVESEAGNQSLDARIAVCNVIMNQIHSPYYKNTIPQVIYDKAPSGAYHFSVVYDNRINEVVVSDKTREAVLLALAGERRVDWNVTSFATEDIDFSDWCVPDVKIGDVQFWIPKIAR